MGTDLIKQGQTLIFFFPAFFVTILPAQVFFIRFNFEFFNFKLWQGL